MIGQMADLTNLLSISPRMNNQLAKIMCLEWFLNSGSIAKCYMSK